MSEKSMDQKQPGIAERIFTDKDLGNEEVVFGIFERGIPEEIEHLRVFCHGTQEQMELAKYYAQLRRATLDKMRLEIDNRIETLPRATEEELAMGAYQEQIEPQVRDTVRVFRRKGYSTFSSGFDGLTSQHILCAGLQGIELPAVLIQDLKDQGILFRDAVRCQPGEIAFEYSRPLTMEEIKQIWDKIAEAMPDLGHRVLPSTTGAGDSFRKRQQAMEIKNKK